MPIIESGLVYNLLFQEHFTEDIENYKQLLNLTADHAYMLAVVCGETQEGNHMTDAVGSSVKLQEHDHLLREALKEAYPGVILGMSMSNKLPGLVPCEERQMSYEDRIALIERSRELVRELKRRTQISFRIGISAAAPLEAARDSYKEAVNALIMTTGSVAHADDLPIGCAHEETYPLDLEKKLFAEVKNGDAVHAVATAESYFDAIEERYGNLLMNIRLKVLEFVLYAEYFAYHSGGMTYAFRDRADYLPTVMEAEDASFLRKWFADRIGEACRSIGARAAEKSLGAVEAAKAYIRGNYSKDISLDEVSQAVNISPYYFSKIFKEEVGEGFVEYLTGLRMEKAKELLASTEYSMKEICAMSGYADPNYFSRIFKKNTGVTPTEYKQYNAEKRREEGV